MNNLPPVIECAAFQLGNYPRASREVLASGAFAFNGHSHAVQLIHRTSGYEIAGSAMRLCSNEAWGVLWQARDGSRLGQWFKTELEALAFFERKTARAAA